MKQGIEVSLHKAVSLSSVWRAALNTRAARHIAKITGQSPAEAEGIAIWPGDSLRASSTDLGVPSFPCVTNSGYAGAPCSWISRPSISPATDTRSVPVALTAYI